MTINKLRENKGFTLIEVLIAVFFLVVVLLGIISTTVMVINNNALSKTETTASTLAKDKMEQLKNQANRDYSDLAGGSDVDGIFTRTWTVTVDTPISGMKTLVVTVSWNWKGTNRSVVLRGMVSR
ncbi:MAG: prepilin-type N-terminal cleavage/methylation domain-containing protein [Deltaproteobacteria bacterium]|nr:prepilin-type N-terminal cleavage/methylation domain-containing protein [Deltaproteobacteria bacterium]